MATQAFSLHLSPNSSHFPEIIPFHIPMSMTSDSLSKTKKAASSSSSLSPIDGDKLTNSVSSLLSSLGILALSSGNFQVAVDWKETSESHVIKVELPGMKKEQVKIEMEDEGGHVLVISGEKKDKEKEKEKEKEGDKWIFAEIRSGKFCRRFKLPENAKADEIQAKMVDGVLTVTFPKVQAPKKTAKSIQISAA